MSGVKHLGSIIPTTRKMIIDRNGFCGAFENAYSTKIFVWRIKEICYTELLEFCGA
jgi:hypothetical protein